jgi:hypothetical protein
MPLTNKLHRAYYSKLSINVALALCALFLLGILYFSVFYFTTGRETMEHWFYSLNGCFYNYQSWPVKFFNDTVKEKGNTLAQMGAGVAAFLLLYLIARWKKIAQRHIAKAQQPVNTVGWQWYLAVFALAIASGTYSWLCMKPCYDEIFSAVNCAAAHPFQTIAYYMLPNNHMYYNLLNNLLFSWWCNDLVHTGRILSVAAYTFTLLFVYNWLSRLISNKLFAFLALLPVAFQFTAWAMAAQGRGYSLELMCAWITSIAMLRFLLGDGARYLRVHAVFTIFGFIIIPAYLSVFVAQSIVLVATMIYNRHISWRYFKYQVMVVMAVFLFYLPAFCFSGIAAFTENAYVKPITEKWMAFLPEFAEVLRYFINFCFSMLCGEDRAINFVLFFLPLGLFFSKQKQARLAGFYYVALWLTYTVVTINLRRNPFNRNMIAHFSLTMGFVVYTFYILITEAAQLLKGIKARKVFTGAVYGLPVLAYTTFLVITNRENVSYLLYFNDVNQIYGIHIKEMTLIPKGSKVGFSYETFYMYYHFKLNHYKVVACPDGTEDYYVKTKNEQFPPGKEGSYIKIGEGFDDYGYYKKK